jgi:heme/copper-type cytochrome/quinol oxidase subunit 2
MTILVIPIIVFAWSGNLHAWFKIDPATDHALEVKKLLFNPIAFTVMVPVLLTVLGLIARNILGWSLAQDKDGAAHWTSRSRKMAAAGIFAFAFFVTLLCFYLMKSLQHQFFSTMYGVYYFAGSVWTTLITLYVLTVFLSRPGMPLEKVYFKRQQQDLGVLFFAFTVFYAYIHFSQYFLIWNAAIPEETFWYVLRERGSWKWVGMTILFGHFFVPFLTLLNQDIKRNLAVMVPVAVWAWLMHYVDMTFNVMPAIHPEGLSLTIWDPLFWFGMAAVLGFRFWTEYRKNPPYPLNDPRLKEAVTHHEVPAPGVLAAH